MLRLIIEDDEGKTTVVPLIRDEITIGRKEGNTIRLTERNVSRCHARLLRATAEVNGDSTIVVEDLDSYNGIRLNGERIPGKCTMRAGDLMQIGDYSLALQSDEHKDAGAAHQSTALVDAIIDDDGEPTDVRRTGTIGLPADDQARLVVVSSNLAGESFRLERREMIVGRTEENDVVINHRSISRNHAKIVEHNNEFTIFDLNSSNGVKVNSDQFISQSLVNGDIIELGNVKLRFVAPGEDYVFTFDDVEDVDPDGGTSAGRVLLGLVLVLLGALFAWMIVGRGLEPSAPTPAPVTDHKATTRAEPPPPSLPRTVDVGELVSEANAHLEAQRWQEAVGVARRVLQSEPEHEEAKALLSDAMNESHNQRRFNEIAELVENRQWPEAWFKLEEFPRESVYTPRIEKLRSSIENEFAASEFERGIALMESGQSDGAEEVLGGLEDLPFATAEAKKLEQAIAEARRPKPTPAPRRPSAGADRGAREPDTADSRPAARHDPLDDPPPPRPAAPRESYDDLMKQSLTFIALGKRSEAVAVLLEAHKLRPGSSAPHQRMCSTFGALGQYQKALQQCEQWLAKEKNASYKPVIRKKIQDLQDRLSR